MAKDIFQILICSAFLLTECNAQEKKTIYNPIAIELNNRASGYMVVQKYDSALLYLDSAIKVDKDYYIAFGNKSSVYCALKDYKNSLEETKQLLTIKPELAESWVIGGMLCEKLGDTLNALIYYKRSIELFNGRIANPNKKQDLEANRINGAFSLILIGQERQGRDELKKLKKIYPKNLLLDHLLGLNKRTYLNQIFGD